MLFAKQVAEKRAADQGGQNADWYFGGQYGPGYRVGT